MRARRPRLTESSRTAARLPVSSCMEVRPCFGPRTSTAETCARGEMFRSVVRELATRAGVDTSRIERSRRPGRQLARHASGSRSLEQEDAIRLVADRCGYSRPRSSESCARGSGTARTADAELYL